MRLRLNGRKKLECIFVVGLSLYAALFLHVADRRASSHQLTDKKAIGPVNLVSNNPFQITRKKPNEIRSGPPPIPSNAIRHGIVEGRIAQQLKASNGSLWKLSSVIPDWMKAYFEWHREQRERLQQHPSQWSNSTWFRFYLVECTQDYRACGGTADRLAPLPFHIAMANWTQRLLLIHWTKPAMLEHFLLPPVGGVDWTVPSWLWQRFEHPLVKAKTGVDVGKILKFASKKMNLVRVKFQSHNHGSEYYDSHRREGEPTFEQVYHDAWRVFFTPSPPIASLIEQHLQNMKLIPSRYIAAHVRSLYAVDDRPREILDFFARNTINCVTAHLQTDPKPWPIYFASDSTRTIQMAQQYADYRRVELHTRPHNQQPLHLEKSELSNASGYYDTFVDLYLLGMSRCTVYNMGGFGKWASWIGYNSSCVFWLHAIMILCNYTKSNSAYLGHEMEGTLEKPSLDRPIFFPPMTSLLFSDHATGNDETANGADELPEEDWTASDPLVSRKVTLGAILSQNSANSNRPRNMTKLFNDVDRSAMYLPSHSKNLWDQSSTLPHWMKDYFRWHKKQRALYLNPNQWKQMKYLVMQCLSTDPKCGGTSDRLKPVPTLLRIAAWTKRFLLIHWSRPAKLEEFLMPPKGGIDWRVPDWLSPELATRGVWVVPGEDVREWALSEENTVRSRYQSFNGGSDWYNEHLAPKELPFDEIYHEVWKIFFTPAPPVASAILDELDHLGLVPGDYVSAHVRALYAVQFRAVGSIKRWTVNALDCASQIRPGKPIFLASDSSFARVVGAAYAQFRNASIVSHESYPNPPLHLDKSDNISETLGRLPVVQDFYDTFIDLYLIALGRCVFYFKGGYGHWGLLIGGNITCGGKMKGANGRLRNLCDWTDASSIGFNRSIQVRNGPIFIEPMD